MQIPETVGTTQPQKPSIIASDEPRPLADGSVVLGRKHVGCRSILKSMAILRNSTAALLLILLPAGAWAQQAQPAPGQAEFVVFIAGTAVGREQVNLSQSAENWIITSSGRTRGPVEVTNNRFEVKYAADWQPLELHIDASVGGKPIKLQTSFGLTTAANEMSQMGMTTSRTDQVSPRTIVLPNNFFAAYEALAVRLASSAAGAELPVYVAPQAEIKATVKNVTDEKLASPSGTMDIRRYGLVFQNPGGPLEVAVAVDRRNRLVRVEIPAAGLSVVRSDVAAVSVRPQTSRNPTDVDVTIPASGFNLAGTVTTPPGAARRARHPAIILVAASGAVDRDATVAGIPIFTQLAGALAEQGFVVLRYDKRGLGQSGGRSERVTMADHAEDLISAVKWLRRRKDVDNRRVAVAGHGDGGAVAMTAAARHDDIAALVLIAAPGTAGSDLILEQQRHLLTELEPDLEEREAKIELQRQIQTAVLTGIGWQGIPEELRTQADTPWFKSLLSFDPADVMPRVRQPVLIIHGELDKQIFPHHADKLAALSRERDRKVETELVHLPGINHLLVRAKTGEVNEYDNLPEKTVAPEVARTIADFLKR